MLHGAGIDDLELVGLARLECKVLGREGELTHLDSHRLHGFPVGGGDEIGRVRDVRSTRMLMAGVGS